MRKILPVLALLLLLAVTPALAQNYSFSDIHAAVDIPDGVYDVVLTPYNLSSNRQWLADQNQDADALFNQFEAEGTLLKAIDEKNGRTLVITARKDLDAQTYFDLNNQDDDMRKEFRVSHTDGSAYGVLGYTYTSAKWQNYGKSALRFLRTKYSLHQDGQQICTGYQRRTIRNGYTITLDMQVTGRSAKDADDTALEKIMKTFTFTQVLPMPELPLKLALTSAPPSETSTDTFTIKGKTVKNASVSVAVVSLGASGGNSYQTKANTSGVFTQKVTLPSQGVYSVTITAEAENAQPAKRMYSVTYQRGLLAVNLTSTPGETLTDTTVIAGSTISGAQTQVAVTGPKTYTKTSTKKDFKFDLDTSTEGEYTIVVSVNKKGMSERSFSFTATRAFSEVERVDKIKSAAKKIDYNKLSKDDNKGKYVVYTGYITEVTPTVNEWIVGFALQKSGTGYKNLMYLVCTAEPTYEEGKAYKVYGTASGTYSVLGSDGNIRNYPRVDALFFENAK